MVEEGQAVAVIGGDTVTLGEEQIDALSRPFLRFWSPARSMPATSW